MKWRKDVQRDQAVLGIAILVVSIVVLVGMVVLFGGALAGLVKV